MVLSEQQLKELVFTNKITDEAGWQTVLEYAKTSDKTPSKALVEKGLISDVDLGGLIAKYLKVPFVELSKMSIPEDIFNSIPDTFARKQKVVVFGRDAEGLKVAMARPSKTNIIEVLSKKTGQKVNVYYATPTDIENTLRLYKQDLQMAVDNLLKEDISQPNRSLSDDPPVTKIVDMLIHTAYEGRSSDVHIEPQENYSAVRFRIDGILHEVLQTQKSLHDRIVTRIKVLSNLRTDEHLSAQDGKMRMIMEEEKLDIRVSILPIVDGEKVVLRLLSSHQQQLTLSDLGMNEKDLAKVNSAYTRSYGMILSTGPTGSGKTTSIYAILKELNKPEKNITTIEDPVEYRIKGANQIQVNTKTNLTFANGLRSILRQDPNIVFVGEIRDDETAGIAVNAALTGHLVLSTLHTNDSATALPRLTDMEVEPFLVASTVTVIIAQRLVRKICDKCTTEVKVTQEELEQNFSPEVIKRNFKPGEEVIFHKGAGCKVCRNTGYSGRIGLFEVLQVTPKIKKLIVEKVDSASITNAAIEEGMKTVQDDGIEKILKGWTTLEEVLRVTKAETL